MYDGEMQNVIFTEWLKTWKANNINILTDPS